MISIAIDPYTYKSSHNLFTELVYKIQDSEDKELKEKVIAFILKGTEHKDIFSFHKDISLNVFFKCIRYTEAIHILNDEKR
jgi:hypothetical protein